MAPAALMLTALLCLSCGGGPDAGLPDNRGPGALDLLAPGFSWTDLSATPRPISIPARDGSPLLADGWIAGEHQRAGEACVVSSGPSAALYLPFWPGGEGQAKIGLRLQVIGPQGNGSGDKQLRIAVRLNGQTIVSRPAGDRWFSVTLKIPAVRFHQGDNELELAVRWLKNGGLVEVESARLALSRIELTLPRVESGLLLGRVQQRALVSAGPLAIDLPQALPRGAELHYSVALMPWFAPAADGAVISRITARAIEDPSRACANEHRVGTDLQSSTARAAGCRWRRHRLPLDELAGERIRLELSAETATGAPSSPPLHAWGSLVLTWPAKGGTDTRPYNVIVILADTLRADRLGSGGAGTRLTPHLDRLSRRAVTFRDTAAQASATYPSLSSMFSGDYYSRISPWAQKDGLPPDRPLLGEIFSSGGFHTVGLVSNPLVRPEAGFARGFDLFDNSMIFREASEINKRFLEWLPSLAGSRFFAYLHYMDIHAPYGSPDYPRPRAFNSGRLKGQPWNGGLAAVEQEFIEHGQCSLDQADRMVLAEQYDEGIRYWDRQLGCLLAALQREELLSSTIIVIIADHGEEFFEHGLVNHGQSLYQELVHVPALALFPPGSGIGQPQQVGHPIEMLDILPTLCDFLHVPLPREYRGQSRLPLLLEAGGVAAPDTESTRQPRLFETRRRNWVKPPFNDHLSGIRQGRWKLVHNRVTGESRLFDMRNDPGETRNLAAERPDKVEELMRMADSAFDLTAAGPASEAGDRRQREALEALGYIQ